MNHQRANGNPTQRTIAFAISGTFMYIGGSIGPRGHPLEVGPGDPPDPHVQLKNQDARRRAAAQIWTGFTFG